MCLIGLTDRRLLGIEHSVGLGRLKVEALSWIIPMVVRPVETVVSIIPAVFKVQPKNTCILPALYCTMYLLRSAACRFLFSSGFYSPWGYPQRS
jgi:hypothetical protein